MRRDSFRRVAWARRSRRRSASLPAAVGAPSSPTSTRPWRRSPARPARTSASTMLEARSGWPWRGVLVGPVTRGVLGDGARGTVRAVFETSFYVRLEAGWAAIGPTRLGAGPLNLLCEAWPSAGPVAGLVRCGDSAWVEHGTLHAGTLRIACAGAEPWWPEPPAPWQAASLARGLTIAADVIAATQHGAGLGLLGPVRGDRQSATLAAAAAPLRYLDQLLRQDHAAAPPITADAIAPLVGLGPGLTPSGDDYLGGMLVALAVIGRTHLRDRLWRALAPLLAERTVDISRAHLAAAAEGLGSASLHGALNAILAGARDDIAVAIAALARVGHTSGMDALAGVLAVLRRA